MTLFKEFSRAAAQHGHAPAVVFRDAGTGERTELSFATLHNWVSKTANLLLDDLDVMLGDEVTLHGPVHWLMPVACLATWATGAAIRLEPGGTVDVGHEADGADDVDLLLGAGMGGRPLTVDDPDSLTVPDVLRQPDDFVDDPGDDGAWVIGGRSQATVLAEGRAANDGVERLLWHADRLDQDLVFLIAKTLPVGCGLVLARGYDIPGLERVREQERAEVAG